MVVENHLISVYSVISAIIFFNVALAVVYLLRRKSSFIASYGIYTVLLVFVLGVLRLLAPVEVHGSIIVHSERVLPFLRDLVRKPLLGEAFTVGTLVLCIWGLGTLIWLIRYAVQLAAFRRERAGFSSCDVPAVRSVQAALAVKAPIRVSPEVQMPYVTGYFKPEIYLPPLELSEAEWRFVIRHEQQHIASRDQLIKLVFLLLSAVFWWNPITHFFLRELDAVLELKCDERLTAKLDEEEKLAYYETMLAVMAQITPRKKAHVGNVTLGMVGVRSRSRENIKQRFQVFADSKKRKSKLIRGLVWAVIILVFALSYFVLFQPYYEPPVEDLTANSDKSNIPIAEEVPFILTDGKHYWLMAEEVKVMELRESDLEEMPYSTLEIRVLEE